MLFTILGPSTASGQSLPGKVSLLNVSLDYMISADKVVKTSVISIDTDKP